MPQKSQPGQESNQSDLLPEVPNRDTQDETQDTLPITQRPRANVQDPPTILHTGRVSLQEPSPISYSRRVSIQEPPPSILHTRRLSTQEPPPSILHTRRLSTQEPPPSILHTRRLSTQEPPPSILHTRRLSTQEPPPSILHTRRLSTQEPPPSILHTRRLSTQEPPSVSHTRRVSIQEPPSITYTHRVSVQEPPSPTHTRWASIQEAPSFISGPEASFQGTSSVPYSSNVHTPEAPPGFESPQYRVQSPSLLITHDPGKEPVAAISNAGFEGHLPTTTTQDPNSSTEGAKLPTRAKVDIPPSITNSPEASINSIESILRTSQETSKKSLANFQFIENTLRSNTDYVPPPSSGDSNPSRVQDMRKHRPSQLPLSWRLLHEARKISRKLSLLLSLAGMAILGLICMGQPWMHFQVPLTPPGDPAGPLSIPINTVLFVRCTDISCMQEHDYKAYLLDLAWISLLIASITGSCLCLILINLIFFSSSNFPILDFSIIVISLLTGTSITLGVLFYLMQAHEFLQEGMTYRLGRSFYLAWMGIFLFLMTGFFSFLNYIKFWSLLALHAIWT